MNQSINQGTRKNLNIIILFSNLTDMYRKAVSQVLQVIL